MSYIIDPIGHVRGGRIDMPYHFGDGTPVIDIKPVMSGFQPRGEFREPDWAHEIMGYY